MEALYGYRMLGAQRHAAILETAIATYIRERPQLERFRGSGTAQDFAAWTAYSALGTLDWQFWSLATAEDPHVRRHPLHPRASRRVRGRLARPRYFASGAAGSLPHSAQEPV